MVGRGPPYRRVGSPAPNLPQLNYDLHDIAKILNAKVRQRKELRLPAKYRVEFEAWIARQGVSGRLSVDYSEGTACWLVWEETI